MSCRPVTVQIHVTNPDGTVSVRSWMFCGDSAPALAAHFGEPHEVRLITAEALAAAESAPGVVVVRRQS